MTAREAARAGLRLQGRPEPVGRILYLDARGGLGHNAPTAVLIPADQIEALRERLSHNAQPDIEDRRLIDHARASGQAIWAGMWPSEDFVSARLTPARAAKKYARLWETGSPDKLVAKPPEAESGSTRWKVATWHSRLREEDERDHVIGELAVGPKRGDYTRMAGFDLDRHHAGVDLVTHATMVANLVGKLNAEVPDRRPHAEVSEGGSARIHLVLPKALTHAKARAWVEELRKKCGVPDSVETWPGIPGIVMGCRPDRVVVVGDRALRASTATGRKKDRVKHAAHDMVQIVKWIEGEGDKTDPELVWQTVIEQGRSLGPVAKARRDPGGTRRQSPSGATLNRRSGTGKGNPVQFKGCFRKQIVGFLRGEIRPEDGALERWTTPILRTLIREGMAPAAAADWLRIRLQNLPDKSFSGRLERGSPELDSDLRRTARNIATEGNGRQRDPQSSAAILYSVMKRWSRIGFKLSDPTTWDARAPEQVARRLDWSDPILMSCVPGLIEILGCSVDDAKKLVERLCQHAAELSHGYTKEIMRGLGLLTGNDTVQAVRDYLKDVGVLVLVKKGFRWGDQSGVGSSYCLGAFVQWESCKGNYALYTTTHKQNNGLLNLSRTSIRLTTIGVWVMARRRSEALQHVRRRLEHVGWLVKEAA